MKIFFLENDSFHKIYKTIEKISDRKKKITCFVDEKNSLFHNTRQGKQLHTLIKEKEINITRIAKSSKSKNFFEDTKLTYEYRHKNTREKKINFLSYLIFQEKNRHPSWIKDTKYLQYTTRGVEYFFIFAILYAIYVFIWPSAKITIEPKYTLQEIVYNFRYYPEQETPFRTEQNQLSIPYKTGSITHTISLKQSVKNLSNTQRNAKGSITLYNKTDIPYKIIPNTTFITDDGILFRSPKAFNIPARISKKTPGEVSIELIAKDTDINDNIVGKKGNIKEQTTLYIKNLKTSYLLKNIYAKANKDFTGGETLSKGMVEQTDIDQLKKKLIAQVTKQNKHIIKENLTIPDAVLLHFEKLLHTKTKNFITQQKPGDKESYVEGSITATYTFPYVTKSDIIKQFESYIRARSSNVEKLVDIQSQSLTLLNIKNIGNNKNTKEITIPTAVTTIQAYNFENDPHNILGKLKKEATGKSVDEFKNIAKKYKQISTITIDVNPFRLKQIPTTKSRIFFLTK